MLPHDVRGEVCRSPGGVAGGHGVEGGVGGRHAAAGEQLASCRSWGAAAGAARHGQVGQRAVVPRRRGAAQGEARAGRGTCSKLDQLKSSVVLNQLKRSAVLNLKSQNQSSSLWNI